MTADKRFLHTLLWIAAFEYMTITMNSSCTHKVKLCNPHVLVSCEP